METRVSIGERSLDLSEREAITVEDFSDVDNVDKASDLDGCPYLFEFAIEELQLIEECMKRKATSRGGTTSC